MTGAVLSYRSTLVVMVDDSPPRASSFVTLCVLASALIAAMSFWWRLIEFGNVKSFESLPITSYNTYAAHRLRNGVSP
jgi:hypothetical protein